MSNVKHRSRAVSVRKKKIARERMLLIIAAVIVIAGNVIVRGVFADAHEWLIFR